MSTRVKLIFIVLIVIGVAVGGYFAFTTYTDLKESNTTLTKQVEDLQVELLEYGDVRTIYIAVKPLKVGAASSPSDFVASLMPSVHVTSSFITDLSMLEKQFYKVDITEGTPLTKDLVIKTNVERTLRYLDVISDLFPIEPSVGDYYDFRIITPAGNDYIYLPKKRVSAFYGTAVRILMTENDILTYQSALVDTFLNPGTVLYVTKYVEPSMQEPATPFYPVSDTVLKAMELDPNIISLVEQEASIRQRSAFNNANNTYNEDSLKQIVAGRSAIVAKLNEAARNVLQQGGIIDESGELQTNQKELEAEQNETTPPSATTGAVDPNETGSGMISDPNSNNPNNTDNSSDNTTGIDRDPSYYEGINYNPQADDPFGNE